jgi:hypothetical protein
MTPPKHEVSVVRGSAGAGTATGAVRNTGNVKACDVVVVITPDLGAAGLPSASGVSLACVVDGVACAASYTDSGAPASTCAVGDLATGVTSEAITCEVGLPSYLPNATAVKVPLVLNATCSNGCPYDAIALFPFVGSPASAVNGTVADPLSSRNELGRDGGLGKYCGAMQQDDERDSSAIPVHFVAAGILAAVTLARACLWRFYRPTQAAGPDVSCSCGGPARCGDSAALRGLAPLHVYVGLVAPFHAAAAVAQAATALAHCAVITAAVAVLLRVTNFGGTGPLAAVNSGYLWAVLLVVPGTVAAVAVRTPLHVLCTLRHIMDRRRLYLAACRRLGAAPKRPLPEFEFDAPASCKSVAPPPMPPVPRWDFGAACGTTRPQPCDFHVPALTGTPCDNSGASDPRKSSAPASDETAALCAVPPASKVESSGRRRVTPEFSAATHARVSCARTQAAAVALAVVVTAVAVAVAAVASSGWCPAAIRRYGVVAATALVVDCVALQVAWVGAVALWRWMTAVGDLSSIDHPPYPRHGAWST